MARDTSPQGREREPLLGNNNTIHTSQNERPDSSSSSSSTLLLPGTAETVNAVVFASAASGPSGMDGYCGSPCMKAILDDTICDVDDIIEEGEFLAHGHNSHVYGEPCSSGGSSNGSGSDSEDIISKMASSTTKGIKKPREPKVKPKFLAGVTERQFWLIFMGIMIANFIGAFDSTIMASTHTSVTATFNSANSASWLSTSFLLTSTSFQPLYGRFSDIYGRRIPFLIGLIIFAAGTLWCALATSILTFILARAICGIGCGGVWTMGAIVLSDIIPIEVRGTYQSVNNLTYGLGSMLGAALGGWMADSLGWRWAFGVQVPPIIVCIFVVAMTVPDMIKKAAVCKIKPTTSKYGSTTSCPEPPQQAPPAPRKKFDVAGSVLLPLSTALLIFALSTGGNIFPWSSPIVLVSLFLSLILSTLFVRAELSAPAPIMPLKLLTSRPRGHLIFSNFFQAITINSIIFNLPLFFQAVRLESATVAGGRLLIPSVANTLSAATTGVIITGTGKLGPTLRLGGGLLVLGSLSLCFMTPDLGEWAYNFLLIPSSLGMGFAFPSTIMSVLATSRQTDQAVATSTLIMWRSLGSVIGIASSSLVVQNVLLSNLLKDVRGPNGEFGEREMEVVEVVRRSVLAVAELPEGYRAQVVGAYRVALGRAFLWALGMAIMGLGLSGGVKLPGLSRKDMGEYRRAQGESESESESGDDESDEESDFEDGFEDVVRR
ncbi:multidrug resistance protein fnx1-like protein [Peziza echinospora]|nr:multidrug resistance protein fnx1-like protein [Peziza echinospora]